MAHVYDFTNQQRQWPVGEKLLKAVIMPIFLLSNFSKQAKKFWTRVIMTNMKDMKNLNCFYRHHSKSKYFTLLEMSGTFVHFFLSFLLF